MYRHHPDFRNFYNSYHPELSEFIDAAMNMFSEQKPG